MRNWTLAIIVSLACIGVADAKTTAGPSTLAVRRYVFRNLDRGTPMTSAQVNALSFVLARKPLQVRTVDLEKHPTIDNHTYIYLPRRAMKRSVAGIPEGQMVVLRSVEELPDEYALLPIPARWSK
jgi:hypothetical protein